MMIWELNVAVLYDRFLSYRGGLYNRFDCIIKINISNYHQTQQYHKSSIKHSSYFTTSIFRVGTYSSRPLKEKKKEKNNEKRKREESRNIYNNTCFYLLFKYISNSTYCKNSCYINRGFMVNSS